MVESVTAPDDETVVFKLKYPSGAFMPALASPYHFIYSKAILDKDPHWYEKNVMGSGPFVFEAREAGAVGQRQAQSQLLSRRPALPRRLRGDLRQDAVAARAGHPRRPGGHGVPRPAAEEPRRPRGRPRQGHHGPGERLELRAARHAEQPQEAVRRCARAQGPDPGGRPLGRLDAISPRSPSSRRLAASSSRAIRWRRRKEELEKFAGYSPDIKAVARGSQAPAEGSRRARPQVHAGQPRRRPALHHRRHLADRPMEAGGHHRRQKMEPTGPFYATLENGAFDVALEFNCQSVVNPLVDTSKFLPDAGDQYGGFKDPELIKLYDAMNRTGDVAEQKTLMRAYEKRVIDEEVHNFITLLVVPHHPAPLLRQRLEDLAQPLPEPGPVGGLARQVAGLATPSPAVARRRWGRSVARNSRAPEPHVPLCFQAPAADDPDAARGGGAGVLPDAPHPGRHLHAAAWRRAAAASIRRC